MKNNSKKLLFFYFFILLLFSIIFITGQQNSYEIVNSKLLYIADRILIPSSVQNGKFNIIIIFDPNIEKIFLDKTELDIIENGKFRFSFFALPLNNKKDFITIKIEKNQNQSEFKIPVKEKQPYPKSEIILDSVKQSIVSSENSAKREEETKFFNSLLSFKTQLRYFTLPFANPLEFMKIVSVFANSRIYKDTKGNILYTSTHLGVDLKASENTKVYAISTARVAFAGYSITRGNCVYLDHGFGLYSSYFHLNKIVVEEGRIIYAGELLGFSGSTGISTGPHLHLGASLNGFSIDPISLIEEMNQIESDFEKIKDTLKKE